MPSLSSIARRARKLYRATPLDDLGLDDVVSAAEDYLRGPLRAFVQPGSLFDRDTRSAIGRTIGRGTEIGSRTVYRPFVDPLREIANRELDEIQDDPRRIVPKLINPVQGVVGRGFGRVSDAPGENPWEQFQSLGRSYRERPNTLEKRVVTNAVDPMNLLGVLGKGAIGPRLGRAAMEAFASAGLQTVGGIAGERIGGRTGGAIGELAGLVGGNFTAEGLQALTRAPRTVSRADDAARIASKFNVNPDGTISLHSGIPMPGNMVGILAGTAAAETAAPDDTSLRDRIFIGVGGGIAGLAAAQAFKGRRGIKALNEVVDSSRNVPDDMRKLAEDYRFKYATKKGTIPRTQAQLRDAKAILQQAQVTPQGVTEFTTKFNTRAQAAATRLQQAAASGDIAAYQQARSDLARLRSDRLFTRQAMGLDGGFLGQGGTQPAFVAEHPDWFTYGGAPLLQSPARQVAADIKQLGKDTYQEDVASGQWNAQFRRWRREAQEATDAADRARQDAADSFTRGLAEASRQKARLTKQAEAFRQASAAAEQRRIAAEAGGIRLGTPTQAQSQAANAATNAMNRATSAATGAVDLVQRAATRELDNLATRFDRISGAATAKAMGAGRNLGTPPALSTALQQRVDGALTKIDTLLAGSAGQRQAAQRLRSALTAAAASNDAQRVQQVQRAVDDLGRVADQVEQTADLARRAQGALPPKAVNARLAVLNRALNDMLVQGNKGATLATARGQSAVAADVKRLEGLRNRLDRRAALADAAATRVDQMVMRRALRDVQRHISAAAKHDTTARDLLAKINQPVENYVPHIWDASLNPNQALGATTIGGTKFYQNERAFPTLLEGYLSGLRPAKMEDGSYVDLPEMFGKRLSDSARAQADRLVVDQIVKDVTSGNGRVVPSFQYKRLTEAEQKEYVALADAGLRIGGDNAKDELRDIADDIGDALKQGGLPPSLTAAERRRIISEINRGDVTYYVKKDSGWLRTLESIYRRPIERGQVRLLWDAGKEAKLSGFPDHAMRQGLAAGLQMASVDPIRTPGALRRALMDSLTPARYARFQAGDLYARSAGFTEVSDAMVSGLLDIAPREGALHALVQKGGAWRALTPFERMERWTFERFMPALTIHAYDAVARAVIRKKNLTNAADILAEQRQVGAYMRKLMNGISAQDVMNSPRRALLESIPIISPGWMRRPVWLATAPFRGGTTGMLARRFWFTALTSALVISGGVTKLFNPEMSWQEIYDPTAPNSVTNPTSGAFLSVTFWDGTRLSPFSEVRSLVKMATVPFAEGNEAREEGKGFGGVLSQISDSAVKQGTDFFTNRLTPPAGLTVETIRERQQFPDAPLWAPDTPMHARAAILAGRAARAFTPAPLSGVSDDREYPTGSGPSKSDQAYQFIAEGIGLRYTPGANHPDEVTRALVPFLRANRIDPGNDPVQAYKAADLDPSVRTAFREQNPGVVDYIEAQRDIRLKQAPQLSSRQRNDRYANAKDQEDRLRDERIRSLDGQPIDANTYRERVQQIQRDYAAGLRARARDIYGETDEAKLDAILAGQARSNRSAEEQALDGLYAITPQGDTFEAQKQFFRDRDAYLQSLDPAMRARIRQMQLDKAASPRHRELLAAQEQMAGLYKIPQYRGMDVEQAETVARQLARAESMQQLLKQTTGRPYPLRAVILRYMTDLTAAEKRQLILASMGRLRNRERDRYRMSQSLISTYYSDLTFAETGQILDRIGA